MKAGKRVARAARELFRACFIDGRLDEPRVRVVAERLALSRRRGSLPMLSHFERLVRLEGDRHAAHIESAALLTTDVRSRISQQLTRMYGPGLETTFAEIPALIGGVRVRVGSDVYDGSIRGRLAGLERRL
jgi:F-type H+-transporting ATPase subunit delta